MKGYRFYAEYPEGFSKRRPVEQATNVVAVLVGSNGHASPYYNGHTYVVESIAALFDHPDSATASTGVSHEHLSKRCKRVSEERARGIHPALFAWLDSFDDEVQP